MHWIITTLLMFVFSVVLYLFIRRASLDKLPVHFNNLASFGIPLFVFAVGALLTRQSLVISFANGAILLLASIFFSYLPSRASLKSIALAPNPGYSLVLSKSYVVTTTFIAVPLFGAHLSVASIVAVLLIVGFAALIMLSSKATHRTKGASWLILALAAFFGWGFLSLTAKYLFLHGVSPMAFLVYNTLVVTVCILTELYRRRIHVASVTQHFWPFLLIGLGSAGFNFFNFYSIKIAPNVGYVNAANAASIAAVTLCAAWLFGDDLSLKKVIGVFGVVAGLFLLFLS